MARSICIATRMGMMYACVHASPASPRPKIILRITGRRNAIAGINLLPHTCKVYAIRETCEVDRSTEREMEKRGDVAVVIIIVIVIIIIIIILILIHVRKRSKIRTWWLIVPRG